MVFCSAFDTQYSEFVLHSYYTHIDCVCDLKGRFSAHVSSASRSCVTLKKRIKRRLIWWTFPVSLHKALNINYFVRNLRHRHEHSSTRNFEWKKPLSQSNSTISINWGQQQCFKPINDSDLFDLLNGKWWKNYFSEKKNRNLRYVFCFCICCPLSVRH